MKYIVHRFRISKFKRFAEGLLYAFISGIALIQCLTNINTQTNSQIMLTFSIAMISMLMGLISMFHNEQVPKRKCEE
jgi:high-affinity Fe2+/Pb2+ permease